MFQKKVFVDYNIVLTTLHLKKNLGPKILQENFTQYIPPLVRSFEYWKLKSP